jgi:hypothetical protein
VVAEADRGSERIFVTRGEIAGFLIQSVALASSMAFTTGVVIRQLLSWPLSLACGLGLLAGMLCSYPTIRLLARADGTQFSFVKWLAIAFSAAALASTAISVL